MILRIALILAVLGSYVGTYFYGEHNGSIKEHARQMDEAKLVQDVQEAANLSAAKAIANIEVKNTTIKQEVQREILEKPVYRECRHDAIGLSLINAALTGTEPVGNSELSKTNPAH